MAETDFYEHTDQDSVMRRRSIMRTVNKDDCLIARGANPRTGLITPGANSIAGSLDSERAHLYREKGPSAQWKLEGDQWVSIMPEEQVSHSEGKSAEYTRIGNQQLSERLMPCDQTNHPSQRQVSPLTETNLRSISDARVLPPRATPNPSAQPHTPLQLGKIRRKPLPSPPKPAYEISPALPTPRSPSDETVVRTPLDTRAEARKQYDYFGPNDVGKGMCKPQTNQPDTLISVARPFLGMTVKSRNVEGARPQGFTQKTASLNQLQNSLRTSSGPFPLPRSRQRLVPIHGAEYLHSSNTTNTSSHAKRSNQDVRQRLNLRGAQRAYLPDTVISYDHTRQHCSPQGLKGVQCLTQSILSQTETMPELMLPDAHHIHDMRRDVATLEVPDIASTNTNIYTHTFSERMATTQPPMHQDHMSSRHAICPERTQNTENHPWIRPILREECSIAQLSPSEDKYHEIPAQSTYPELCNQLHEALSVSRTKDNTTTMEPRHLSKLTGTMDGSSFMDGALGEDGPSQHKDMASYTMDTGKPIDRGVRLVLGEIREVVGLKPGTYEDSDLRDHSACCPECCVKFDCHEGCLGHPTPDVSIVDGEASSLASMGIFDASFETSIKAVNSVYLEREKKGKLDRIKVALTGPRIQDPKSSPKALEKQSPLKRTLRPPHTSQKARPELVRAGAPILKGPRNFNQCDTVTAATKAMHVRNTSGIRPAEQHSVQSPVDMTMASLEQRKIPKDVVEANEGRRVSGNNRKQPTEHKHCAMPPSSTLGDTLVENGLKDATPPDTDRLSVLDRMTSFIACTSIHIPLRSVHVGINPAVQGLVQLLFLQLKGTTIVVLDTSATLAAMLFEYNRTGLFVVPQDTNASEFVGNCLRTALYLMVGACLYALFVKISRVVLVVLRIVLLPVRICAWIIG